MGEQPFTLKLSSNLHYATDSSAWYWRYNGVPSVGKNANLLADKDDVLLVTRSINGNVAVPNGLEERKMFTIMLKNSMQYESCTNKK